MNRAERRRLDRNKKSEPVFNMKLSDITNIKEQVSNDAADKAFFLMLAIPVMVLHDKYSLLMRREVDGKSREERFADFCLDLYDSFEKGYVTINDLHQCLWEEAGMKIERVKGNGKK